MQRLVSSTIVFCSVLCSVYSSGFDSVNWKQINERLKRLSEGVDTQWRLKNIQATFRTMNEFSLTAHLAEMCDIVATLERQRHQRVKLKYPSLTTMIRIYPISS